MFNSTTDEWSSENINTRKFKNQNALIHALSIKNNECVNVCIENAIDVNYQNNVMDTALTIAIKKNVDFDMIKLLIESKSNVNVKTCNGKTPLILSINNILHDDLHLFGYLLDNNANVNDSDCLGKTPLMYIIDNNILDVVDNRHNIYDAFQTLLQLGANINALDKNEKNVMMYALTEIMDEDIVYDICKICIDNKIKLDTCDFNKRTVLMFSNRFPKVLKLILEHNKDIINMMDKQGNTTLVYALKGNFIESIKHLLKYNAKI